MHIGNAAGDFGAVVESVRDPAAGQCRAGLSVPDLDEFHARMLAHGAGCLAVPKLVFGARLAQYADPDGLAIAVSESRQP